MARVRFFNLEVNEELDDLRGAHADEEHKYNGYQSVSDSALVFLGLFYGSVGFGLRDGGAIWAQSLCRQVRLQAVFSDLLRAPQREYQLDVAVPKNTYRDKEPQGSPQVGEGKLQFPVLPEGTHIIQHIHGSRRTLQRVILPLKSHWNLEENPEHQTQHYRPHCVSTPHVLPCLDGLTHNEVPGRSHDDREPGGGLDEYVLNAVPVECVVECEVSGEVHEAGPWEVGPGEGDGAEEEVRYRQRHHADQRAFLHRVHACKKDNMEFRKTSGLRNVASATQKDNGTTQKKCLTRTDAKCALSLFHTTSQYSCFCLQILASSACCWCVDWTILTQLPES